MMIVEKLVEWRLARETEVLGENLPQRRFVHHKSHMARPGFEFLVVTYISWDVNIYLFVQYLFQFLLNPLLLSLPFFPPPP
jgi:hypothetical protein